MEPNQTRFHATVIDPLMAGYLDAASNTEFKVAEGDQPSIKAILLHMYLEAARAAALCPTAARAAAADTGPAPAMLNLPSPPAGPPPKSFDAWGPLVQAYNAKLLDGKPRQFPTRRLAGADAVLSRIYHEHTVSKAYTPLMLGEILSARTWTSADELNKLAAGGRDTSGGALHVVAGAVVATEEKKAWEPRGVMAFIDGLEAVRLAWILTGLGEEGYIAWWDKKARARAVNIEALGHYWTSTATTLAMEMRQRRTFKEVTSDIMSNVSAFLEAMAAPPPRAEPKGKTKPQPPTRRELDTVAADPPPPPPKKFKGEKGKKGRKGEGKGRKGGGQAKGADKRQDAQRLGYPVLGPPGLGPISPPRPEPQVLGGRGRWLAGRPSSRPWRPSWSFAASGATTSPAFGGTSFASSRRWLRTPRTTPTPGCRLCPTMCAPPTSLRIDPVPFRACCSTACSGAWATRRRTRTSASLGPRLAAPLR